MMTDARLLLWISGLAFVGSIWGAISVPEVRPDDAGSALPLVALVVAFLLAYHASAVVVDRASLQLSGSLRWTHFFFLFDSRCRFPRIAISLRLIACVYSIVGYLFFLTPALEAGHLGSFAFGVLSVFFLVNSIVMVDVVFR